MFVPEWGLKLKKLWIFLYQKNTGRLTAADFLYRLQAYPKGSGATTEIKMAKTEKNQIEQEADGSKDTLETMYMEDRLPPGDYEFMTDEEETLFICHNVISAYKQLIGSDQPALEKLAREMTKPFVSASAVVSRLNRVKK